VGQRGPKPKPAALKLLAGNPGKRPQPASSGRGRVRKGVPDRPPELTGEAAAEWDRLAPELDAAGLLAVTDRGTLAAYCLAWQDMLAARATIAEEGRYIRTPVQTSTGDVIGERVVEHPAVKHLDQASKRLAGLGDKLGVAAASRARLEGDGGAEERGNKVQALRDRIAGLRNGG
jgi:P27 family predicted phage terminase small subunit